MHKGPSFASQDFAAPLIEIPRLDDPTAALNNLEDPSLTVPEVDRGLLSSCSSSLLARGPVGADRTLRRDAFGPVGKA